jgi:hypothetical protein
MRLPLLVLAALLLVADLYFRSTMAGQLGRALEALSSWWAAQQSAIEVAKGLLSPEAERAERELRERRDAEMQVRLAEHVARRSERFYEESGSHAEAEEERDA